METYKEIANALTAMGRNIEGLVGNFNNMSERIKKVEEHQTGLQSIIDRMAAVEEKLKGGRVVTLGIDQHERDKKDQKFSFTRAALVISQKDQSFGPFEYSVMKEAAKKRDAVRANYEKRDLTTDIDSGAGFIVPVEYVAELIELLRARVVLDKMGVTRMDGLTSSPVQIPAQTAGATAVWVAENNAITHSQQTVGQVELRAREAGALTVLSNRLLRMSSPSAEQMVRNDLTLQMARLVDLAGLRGTGNLQPLGVLNTPGIGSKAISATPGIDDLYNMLYVLEAANADIGALGWVFHPRTWNTLRQIKDGEGRYILTPDAQQWNVTSTVRSGVSGMLLGYPFRTTTQIPITNTVGNLTTGSEIYFANWEDLLWGEWFGLELKASDVTSLAFEKNQTYIRAIMEIDVAVRHAASFCVDATILP